MSKKFDFKFVPISTDPVYKGRNAVANSETSETFPINKYAFFTALTLVFVDLMKELPITLILRPFNFDTLATQTYEFAIEEMIPHSTIYSSVIIIICCILLIFLKMFLDNSNVFRN